jgi:hypothetical protein
MQEIGRIRPPTPRLVRPEVSARLDAAVMKAIARDRRQRFSDAAEMLHALGAIALDPEEPIEGDPTIVSAPPSAMPRVIDPDTSPLRGAARKP